MHGEVGQKRRHNEVDNQHSSQVDAPPLRPRKASRTENYSSTGDTGEKANLSTDQQHLEEQVHPPFPPSKTEKPPPPPPAQLKPAGTDSAQEKALQSFRCDANSSSRNRPRNDALPQVPPAVPLPPPLPPPPPPPSLPSSSTVTDAEKAASVSVDETLETSEEDLTASRALMEAMGLPTSFDSTQGKHVAGTTLSAAKVKKKPKYRQYMNRRGGFNRPLDS